VEKVMIIPAWLITVAISIVTSIIAFAVSYGKMSQKVKSLEADVKRVEMQGQAIINDVKVLTKNVETISNTLFELKGCMETYIKMMCEKK
jgi:peptidoglycan hydrolase CwlO-like protein